MCPGQIRPTAHPPGGSGSRGNPSAAGSRRLDRRYTRRVTTSERAAGLPTEGQLTGLGDMDPDEFRAAAHAVVDLMADYLETVDERPVLPPIEPGSLRGRFPEPRPRIRRRWTRSSPTTAGWSNRTRPTGSTRASWPISPRRPRGPGSSARCSPRHSTRTRCCGARRRSGRSSRAWSSTGSGRASGFRRGSMAC